MQRNSGYIDKDRVLTLTNGVDYAKGIGIGSHDLHDVHHRRHPDAIATWPRTQRYISLTPSTTTVTEGNSMTFTLATEHIFNGSTLYYSISTVSGTTMVDADFSASPNNGGIEGSFTTTNDSTVLTFGLTAEINPGDAESNVFKLQIREGSVSGTVVIESSNITVTDAISFGTDIRTNFYEISNRIINPPSSADYTGNYDVGEVQQSYTGNARVYLAFKCTTSTTYFNDICVAAVQVLNSAGNTTKQTWNFSSSGNVLNLGWQTSTRANGSSSLLSSYLTPQGASGYTYNNLVFGSSNSRVDVATSTGSSSTGMADGIASGIGTLYPAGDNQVAQSSGAFYIYGEVSGAARYSSVFARSPSYFFNAGDIIRVVHAVTTPATMNSSLNINDSLWIGIY